MLAPAADQREMRGARTLPVLKELAPPAIFRKIAWENGTKLLKFKV
jgi:hypothetical protein